LPFVQARGTNHHHACNSAESPAPVLHVPDFNADGAVSFLDVAAISSLHAR